MIINKPNKNVASLGSLFFLILVTIGFLTTNDASRLFIVPIRLISIFLLAAIILLVLFGNRMNCRGFLISIGFLFFITYGALFSVFNDAFHIGYNNLLINVAVTLVGFFFFMVVKPKESYKRLGLPFVCYVVVGFFLTVLVGGFEFNFPPRFVFDYTPVGSSQSDNLYSQGISQFFGLGAIAAAYLSATVKSKIKSVLYFTICFVFALLSLLGGARGDSVAALGVIFFYLALKFRIKFVFLLILSFVLIYVVVGDWADYSREFIILQRLEMLSGGDLGHRDILLGQAVDLISNEIRCLLFGCGFGYFQKFYQYDFGMYPHNIVVEFIIVFGLPMFMVITLLVTYGLFLYYKNCGSVDLFVLFFLYTGLVSLKSGTLFGGWYFTAATLYLLLVLLSHLLQLPQLKTVRKKLY